MRRKILIIVENSPVPPDPRVWKEALALRASGYEVTVLCPKGMGYDEKYEYTEGIHIYRHRIVRAKEGVFGYLLEYASALFWQTMLSWWIFFRRGFDVIHGCNPPDTIFLVALPFRVFGVRYIFDHHDVNPELYLAKYGNRMDFFYRALLRLEKLTFRFSDTVIATNQSYRQIAIKRGGRKPEDVFVVRNGPDLETLNAVCPNRALKHGKRYLVGYVGAMGFQDGLDILLDVIEYIKKTGRTDIHFTCIGTGPAFPRLQEMLDEKDLRDIVNFTGRISDEDMVEILSTSDVCVNPDRPCRMNDISTMIKITDYMALSKPIVQFDLKEGRVSAQEASLYSDTGNQISDFADNILWLLDHPKDRKRMGQFGRARVEDELAWKYSVTKLIDAYDHVFDKRRVHSSNER